MRKIKPIYYCALLIFFIFVGPFIHYLIFGRFPKGFPVQKKNTGEVDSSSHFSDINTNDSNNKHNNLEVNPSKVNAKTLTRFNGFLPFYYEKNSPPDLFRLKKLGANSITICVEEKQGAQESLELLTKNGVGRITHMIDIEGPPPDLNIEAEVEKLVYDAHMLGLVVKLSIPICERWLKKAEKWKVGMVSVGDEIDGGLTPDASYEFVNKMASVFLKETRKYYSGMVGIGFTYLVEPNMNESPRVKYYKLNGFDFLTINPHADPSMSSNPELHIKYIEACIKSARILAERNGIKKVMIGALMVRAESENILGFTDKEQQSYSDTGEKNFYEELFKRTWNLLDGYFLQFSGWETRPAIDVIKQYYEK